VIASGDLWVVEESGEVRRITSTPEPESAPSWDAAGGVLFTRTSETHRVEIATGEESVHRQNAVQLVQAEDGREAFVRDRALWVASSSADPGAVLLGADSNVDVSFRSLRFSPDGRQVAVIRSLADLRGQLLAVNLVSGEVRPIVADRIAENPTGVEWIDNQRLAYITDRGGGIAVWHVDLEGETMLPLTSPLMGHSLGPLGLDVAGERILLPIHEFDSDIKTIDVDSPSRRDIAATSAVESEPAISQAGDRVAYTVDNSGVPEIWTATGRGTDVRYVTLGRHPRFAPNGLELVFTHTDLGGNRDIWKTDVRTGLPTRLTDDPAFDDTPDWSPDGRTIIFFSDAGGASAIWTMPATGGQRVRWAAGGYWPRYSDDGSHVAFWSGGRFVIASADGTIVEESEAPTTVTPPIWDGENVVAVRDMRLPDSLAATGPALRVGPVMDRAPDGSWAIEAIDIRSTAIWRLDLRYTEQ
jgi:Tol biopolymer transport system component